MSKVINSVLETTNYAMFKRLQTNRKENDIAEQKALENLRTIGSFCIPAIVNSHYYILDGQHRIRAAEKLGMPVRYIITNEIKQRHISILQRGKPWTPLDYAKSHADAGVLFYKKLYKLFCNHGNKMKFSSFGVPFQGRSFTSSQMKNKDFRLSSEQLILGKNRLLRLKDLLNCNTELKPQLKSEMWVKILCKAMLCPKFNYGYLLSKLESTTERFPTSRQKDTVSSFFLEFYNAGLPNERKITI